MNYIDEFDLNTQITESVDEELQRISFLVRKTYFNCFDKTTDFSVVTMLQNIENSLETMYKKLKTISPAFISEKQSKFDAMRRNNKRKQKQIQEIEEQRIRMENIIERSKRSMPKERSQANHWFKELHLEKSKKLMTQNRMQ